MGETTSSDNSALSKSKGRGHLENTPTTIYRVGGAAISTRVLSKED
jgi:hypothetical protein